MSCRVFFLVLIFFICTSFSSSSAKELIIKRDGIEIRGEIIAYDKGIYSVRIGNFTKGISETEIKEIRDLGNSISTKSPPGESKSVHPNASSQSANIMNDLMQKGVIPQSSKSSGSANSMAMLQKLINKQMAKGSMNPMQASALSPQMRQQLQGLGNSGAMSGLIGRFKDPGFQQKLLDNFVKMQKALNPDADPKNDPRYKMMKKLIGRLNSHSSNEK